MSETSHNPNYQYDKNKKSIYQCYCCLFFFTTPKFNFDIVKFWPTLIWTINQSNLQKTPKKNHFGYGTPIIRANLLCLNRLLKSEEGIKTKIRDKKHISPFLDQSTIFHARTRTVKTSGNNTNFFTSLLIHLIPLTKSKIISVKQSESP